MKYSNSQFKAAVYELARLIPKGRITTYGAIAKAVGFPNHSRHVGHAMGGCPNDVPAHRVVASCGILRVEAFRIRLENEGIEIKNNRIQDFKNLFWDPQSEIE